ncbi:papain-like cysteine protease family protein [Aliiruegeria lutimaris]|uniref:Papain-like cysteine protease AvrRpt2 n=1 Tax=Aliiruegeria lutimaris TaxID=571298 RepID=A0A1G8Y6H1_9RHOB|nr:papain-like cysteine protease family protein [Aliiruegeria lutimaris]SDJ98237.1 Papain-like cysteine protease AvrRpt2 [Aliiruegeria lutimaris]
MGSIKYDVPRLQQAKSMSCWNAAAMMIGYTYEVGPRQIALEAAYVSNTGITVDEVKKLAKFEGLKLLNSSDHEFTAASLIATLTRYGPIWAAGMWFGVAHAVVVIGCNDSGEGAVAFNDPGDGQEKSRSVSWFNEKRIRGTMLVRGYPPRTIGHWV